MKYPVVVPDNLIHQAQFLPTLTRAPYNIPAERLPSAPQLSRAIVGGRIPAERVGGRWFLNRDHIPAILAKLGLSKEDAFFPTASAA